MVVERRVLVLVVAASLFGCHYPLRAAVRPNGAAIQDRSATSNIATGKRIASIMILPPSGTTRGEFDAYLNEFERAFLARQMRVVSSAVTGRVVQERKSESAAQLSDLERALILARETGAEAVLQIGALEARSAQARSFCGDTGDVLVDCSSSAYAAASYGRQLNAASYAFQGKVIDVKTGEILASLNFTAAAADFLDVDMESDSQNQNPKKIGTCLECEKQTWWCQQCRKAEARSVAAIVDALVQRVSSLSLPEAGKIDFPASNASQL